jgi:serine/threonine protein kinase
MSDRVYHWLDDVEDLELYSKGGYYPITILDTVQSPRTSYRVLHKLGYGSYSTVWLAQDTQTSRLVSLKLLTAEPVAAEGSNEVAMLAHLAAEPRSDSEIPARQYILPLLDSFRVESPNGSHTCLVMEPQGPSIFALRYESDANRLPGHVARKLVPQLASAMAYIHARGIVHGGLPPLFLPRSVLLT